ncbi:MAG: hypothetical protein ACQKBT_12435 [Puniceicoccales bacterium]
MWKRPEDLADGEAYEILTLATPAERKRFGLAEEDGQLFDPSDTAGIRAAVEASARPVVLACPYGIRSAAVARALRASGVLSVYARVGGFSED